ncbi:MAG TPA: hypothetical protein VGJ73_03920 [Verrucomicrobiae bacterium]
MIVLVTFARQALSLTNPNNSVVAKKLDSFLRWITQRLEQSSSHEYRHIMWLTIQPPSNLLGSQSCRQLTEKPQKTKLLLAHASSFTVRSIHEAQDCFAGKESTTSGSNRFVDATESRRLRLHRRSRSLTVTSHAAVKEALDSSLVK